MDEVILGRDWLSHNAVQWNFASGTITLGGKRISLGSECLDRPGCRRCRVHLDTEIPPQTETIVPTDVAYGHFANTGDQWATVPSEPVPGLRVAQTLIPTDTASATVRVCNLTKSPILLHQGQSLSALQSVESVSTGQTPDATPGVVKEQHDTMLHRVDNSVEPEVRAELQALLRSYQDVFSYSEFDLGCTSLAQHDIDTGESRPFKQALRPQPRVHLPAIDKLIHDMESQGVQYRPCEKEGR